MKMLTTISWNVFLLVLFGLIGSYYVIVTVLFYRKEIKRLCVKRELMGLDEESVGAKGYHFEASIEKENVVNPSFSEVSSADWMREAENGNTGTFDMTPEEINSTVHELLEELKDNFEPFRSKKPVKEEVSFAISKVLKKYSSLKYTSILPELNQHIIEEFKHHCSITLSDAEIKRLWNS
jgi:hypothetical protein